MRTDRGYRGGYLPLRRREIERRGCATAPCAVVSTNARWNWSTTSAHRRVGHGGYPGTIAQRGGGGPCRPPLRPIDAVTVARQRRGSVHRRNPSYFFV